MFWLFRMALFACVVLALLPSGGSQQTPASSSAQVGASDAVAAASATVSDMWQFCARQPQACKVGSHAAVAFGERAEAGARMVYDFVRERSAPRDTGSIPSASRKPAAKSSQDTLNAADLAPAWRAPRRDAHNKHGA